MPTVCSFKETTSFVAPSLLFVFIPDNAVLFFQNEDYLPFLPYKLQELFCQSIPFLDVMLQARETRGPPEGENQLGNCLYFGSERDEVKLYGS